MVLSAPDPQQNVDAYLDLGRDFAAALAVSVNVRRCCFEPRDSKRSAKPIWLTTALPCRAQWAANVIDIERTLHRVCQQVSLGALCTHVKSYNRATSGRSRVTWQ